MNEQHVVVLPTSTVSAPSSPLAVRGALTVPSFHSVSYIASISDSQRQGHKATVEHSEWLHFSTLFKHLSHEVEYLCIQKIIIIITE